MGGLASGFHFLVANPDTFGAVAVTKIRQSKVLRWAEVALCLGGGYMIWALSSFGERLVGAYVGLSGMGLYLIATSRDLIQLAVRRRKKGNRTTA